MKVLVLGPDWRNHEIIAVLTELGHDVKLWNEELTPVKLDEWGIDFIVSNGFGRNNNSLIVGNISVNHIFMISLKQIEALSFLVEMIIILMDKLNGLGKLFITSFVDKVT